MKNLPHHLKRLCMKVIRSERRERAQEENYELQATEPEFNKPKSTWQIKKQKKLQKRKHETPKVAKKEEKTKSPLTRTLHEPEFFAPNKVKANRFYKNF